MSKEVTTETTITPAHARSWYENRIKDNGESTLTEDEWNEYFKLLDDQTAQLAEKLKKIKKEKKSKQADRDRQLAKERKQKAGKIGNAILDALPDGTDIDDMANHAQEIVTAYLQPSQAEQMYSDLCQRLYRVLATLELRTFNNGGNGLSHLKTIVDSDLIDGLYEEVQKAIGTETDKSEVAIIDDSGAIDLAVDD